MTNKEYGFTTKIKIGDFITQLRHEVMYLSITEDMYPTTPNILAQKMIEMYEANDRLIAATAEHEREVILPILSLFLSVVQDGFARLVADAKEGMEYSDFIDRCEEERRLWSEQLRMD